MKFVRRRDFLRAGAAAGFVISIPGWATESETPIPIKPPSGEFLATLPHLMELAQLPGLGMGVIEEGQPSGQTYLGLANATTKVPINADSLFPAASMGKQVFAYGALLLVEQGKLDLDRPVKEYLSDGAPTGKWSDKITARHILSHSSGLPNWRPEKDLTAAFEPGTKFGYSGEGFYFLQRCMEHITGVGAEQWLQDTVMKPIGMTSSTYLWRADGDARIVSGHRRNDPFDNTGFAKQLFALIEASGKPLGTWHHEEIVAAMSKDKPAGAQLMPNEISPNVAFSLLTTVSDYSRFLARVLSPTSQDRTSVFREGICKPISRVNSALGWGLGFGIEQEGARPKYLWQWGDNGGWKNLFLIHPETRSGVVVFTNGENGMRVVERVMRAATGEDQAAFLWA